MCLAVIFALGLVSIGMGFSALLKAEIAFTKSRDLHGPAARVAGVVCLVLGLAAVGVCIWVWLHLPEPKPRP